MVRSTFQLQPKQSLAAQGRRGALPALPHSPGFPTLEVLTAGPGPGLVILVPRKGHLGPSQGQCPGEPQWGTQPFSCYVSRVTPYDAQHSKLGDVSTTEGQVGTEEGKLLGPVQPAISSLKPRCLLS
ncbi:Hypothetical predicted protein [Marmota monax]|uniref:Uncharacterized protein n=1 Tax=Marmota monax TaxID=9995 RepID=A0A5E4CKK7_MARMO|nr:hypothetical protein GHT09_006746 [Marmota monax]VTJ81569.1 Hypothetical predicted protein [Marmota monax]